MPDRRVVLTGLGAITPLGNDAIMRSHDPVIAVMRLEERSERQRAVFPRQQNLLPGRLPFIDLRNARAKSLDEKGVPLGWLSNWITRFASPSTEKSGAQISDRD